MHPSLAKRAPGAVKLFAVTANNLRPFLAKRPQREAAFLKAAGFSAREHEFLLMPDAQGALAGAVLGLGKGQDKLATAAFAEKLPPGIYRFA